MTTTRDGVKIQVDRRKDGRITFTIKLVGWHVGDVNGIIYHLVNHKGSIFRKVGEAMQAGLIKAFNSGE